MIAIKDLKVKKNIGNICVCFDLRDDISQISYFSSKEEEPVTMSLVAGSELYNIPTVLAKRKGVGQWYFGKEAIKYSQEGAILVDNILKRSIEGEQIRVEDDMYDPVALLTLFVKRCLGILSTRVMLKDLGAFIFTVDELSPSVVSVLGKLVSSLSLKCDIITYKSHKESFYYYMMHQDETLLRGPIMIFDYSDTLKVMELKISENTEPKVCTIESHFDESVPENVDMKEASPEEKTALDEKFDDIFTRELKDKRGCTIYLLGDGFKGEWMDKSLKRVCSENRVFKGNNLYSKGGCYALSDKLNAADEKRNIVYLGDDKLKANIGMKAQRRGEESYFAILDAGSNYFEAKKDFTMILDEGRELELIVTYLTGGRIVRKVIELDGLPERPLWTTRLSFHFEMSDVNTISIDIDDLGFGDIYRSSQMSWSQILEL